MSQQQPNTPAPNKKQLEQYKELDVIPPPLRNSWRTRTIREDSRLLKNYWSRYPNMQRHTRWRLSSFTTSAERMKPWWKPSKQWTSARWKAEDAGKTMDFCWDWKEITKWLSLPITKQGPRNLPSLSTRTTTPRWTSWDRSRTYRLRPGIIMGSVRQDSRL